MAGSVLGTLTYDYLQLLLIPLCEYVGLAGNLHMMERNEKSFF